MLDIELAQSFIEKLSDLAEYEVSIANDTGTIIASTSQQNVGKFHADFYEIIRRETEDNSVDIVDEKIILPITYEKQRIGAVGIKGSSKDIRNFASAIRTGLEAAVNYKMQNEKSFQYRTNKEAFINQLLFEYKLDKDRLFFLADELSYKKELIRIPILLRIMDRYDPARIIEMIRVHPLHTSQDISYKTDEYHVVIFKNLSECRNILADYKYLIDDYLKPLISPLKKQNVRYCAYIGSFQNNLLYYRNAYNQCKWMEANLYGDERFFFYNHVGKYLKSMIPMSELQMAFQVYKDILDKEAISTFKEVIGQLENTNYNMVQSSKNLYIHKNTMIYRLDKIREKLNVNPFSSSQDKEYLEYLYEYLKNIG